MAAAALLPVAVAGALIHAVMEAQKELLDILRTFQPRLVRMAADEGRFKRNPMPQ